MGDTRKATTTNSLLLELTVAKYVSMMTVQRHSALSCRKQDRSSKVKEHMERVSLSIKTEEVAARLKEER